MSVLFRGETFLTYFFKRQHVRVDNKKFSVYFVNYTLFSFLNFDIIIMCKIKEDNKLKIYNNN